MQMVKNANHIIKERLLAFWEEFGGWKPKLDVSEFDRTLKLRRLQELATARIIYRFQSGLHKRRDDFDKVKHKLCRQRLGSPCFVCSLPGYSRHHIIQLQYGGINSRRNVVILCDNCHADIHPHLKKKRESFAH